MSKYRHNINQINLWKPIWEKTKNREGIVRRTGNLWYLMYFFAFITLQSTTEQWRHSVVASTLRFFVFHGNRTFKAHQRDVDFALVQERHSSKVISYFATKALSLFLKHPGLEKCQWTQNRRKNTFCKSLVCCHLASTTDF